MFRSSEKSNPLDAIVVKATDENLTSDNWELILNVCDAVNDDPEDGAKNAVTAVSKRLNIPNANVQMYSLTLVSSMAQNCGSKMQRELASKSFTKLLLKMAEDKSVHSTVKTKIAELMQSLSDEFKNDPSLRLMNDAYVKLMKSHPSISPPVKPDKSAISEIDKKREQDELQLALALSLSESQQPQFLAVSGSEAHPLEAVAGNVEPSNTVTTEKSAVTVRRVRALYDLTATEDGELSFRKGDVIQVIESVYRDWWRGSLHGRSGIFPLNYVEPLAEPTREELFKEAQDELRVFEQSRNIEKLLVLLNSADANSQLVADNEDVQNLYHSTLSVRPKLVKLIDKYAQKKDELIELNEKFLKARKKYDHLMEDSMAQYTRRHSANNTRPSYPIQQAPYPPSPTENIRRATEDIRRTTEEIRRASVPPNGHPSYSLRQNSYPMESAPSGRKSYPGYSGEEPVSAPPLYGSDNNGPYYNGRVTQKEVQGRLSGNGSNGPLSGGGSLPGQPGTIAGNASPTGATMGSVPAGSATMGNVPPGSASMGGNAPPSNASAGGIQMNSSTGYSQSASGNTPWTGNAPPYLSNNNNRTSYDPSSGDNNDQQYYHSNGRYSLASPQVSSPQPQLQQQSSQQPQQLQMPSMPSQQPPMSPQQPPMSPQQPQQTHMSVQRPPSQPSQRSPQPSYPPPPPPTSSQSFQRPSQPSPSQQFTHSSPSQPYSWSSQATYQTQAPPTQPQSQAQPYSVNSQQSNY